MKYTQDHLTNLLTTDRDKLTRICAEVCYGWRLEDLHPTSYFHGWYDNKAFVMDVRRFNPLENSEKGRSQAFELAVKFQIGSSFHENGCWSVHDNTGALLVDEMADLQSAYLVGAILTAQELQK